MLEIGREAQIRKHINRDDVGEEWIVYMFEDGKLIERRQLGNHNRHYALDVKENWESNIIK